MAAHGTETEQQSPAPKFRPAALTRHQSPPYMYHPPFRGGHDLPTLHIIVYMCEVSATLPFPVKLIHMYMYGCSNKTLT